MYNYTQHSFALQIHLAILSQKSVNTLLHLYCWQYLTECPLHKEQFALFQLISHYSQLTKQSLLVYLFILLSCTVHVYNILGESLMEFVFLLIQYITVVIIM